MSVDEKENIENRLNKVQRRVFEFTTVDNRKLS